MPDGPVRKGNKAISRRSLLSPSARARNKHTGNDVHANDLYPPDLVEPTPRNYSAETLIDRGGTTGGPSTLVASPGSNVKPKNLLDSVGEINSGFRPNDSLLKKDVQEMLKSGGKKPNYTGPNSPAASGSTTGLSTEVLDNFNKRFEENLNRLDGATIKLQVNDFKVDITGLNGMNELTNVLKSFIIETITTQMRQQNPGQMS